MCAHLNTANEPGQVELVVVEGPAVWLRESVVLYSVLLAGGRVAGGSVAGICVAGGSVVGICAAGGSVV